LTGCAQRERPIGDLVAALKSSAAITYQRRRLPSPAIHPAKSAPGGENSRRRVEPF
jgi:hypothetical protein